MVRFSSSGTHFVSFLFFYCFNYIRILETAHQGYRDRYDIIDHGHEKNTFMCFFHRPIFTKIREFATSVLWKLVVHFGYRGRNCTGVDIIS